MNDAAVIEPESGNFTVEAWVRFGALKNQVIVGKIDNGGNASYMGYALRMDTSNNVYLQVGNGSSAFNTLRSTSTTNRWYQIVGVVDASNDKIKLYKDGVLFDQSTTLTDAIKNTSTPLRIGSYNDNDYSQNFNGDIGIVRIYKRALSDADVEQNYKETVLTYAEISNITDKDFTGSPITISPTVTLNGSTLTEGVDYTTTFTDNTNAGTAYLTINGIGSYLGSKTTSFTIIPDTTAPTVTLSDTDDDDLLAASDTVTITANFSEAMTATPTISISGTSISNEVMTKIIGGVGSPTAALIGDDIDGEAADDQSGWAVSLSSDGLRVAIGARGNDGNGSNSGHVRIYELQSDNSWSKLGDDIDGEAAGDWFGSSVSLSSDGSRVAIGAIYNDGGGTNSGHVRIYELQSDNSWSKLGDDIDGEAASDQSGYSVSLSSDGSRVAIGATRNDGNGSDSGHVRIYELQSDNSWSKLGDDIDGEAAGDWFGSSVSLSSDGSRVAIGAIYNDGGGTNSGHVRIYELQSDNSWSKLGDDIDGEAASDESGYSVSLSSDGSRVAIGATRNDGNGSDSGHVRIYELQSDNSWSKLGDDIDGEAASDLSGWSVSLSSDGSSVAIGAIANDGGGTNSGHVRIYEYNSSSNSWYQFFQDIDGEIAADFSGNSVSLSSDGSRVAIGAYFNNENGNNSGHVRLLSVAKLDSYQYTWNISSTLYDGDYQATVAGADKAGNNYAGTDSITFTLDVLHASNLTDTDSDNVVSLEVVTITAGFLIMTAIQSPLQELQMIMELSITP